MTKKPRQRSEFAKGFFAARFRRDLDSEARGPPADRVRELAASEDAYLADRARERAAGVVFEPIVLPLRHLRSIHLRRAVPASLLLHVTPRGIRAALADASGTNATILPPGDWPICKRIRQWPRPPQAAAYVVLQQTENGAAYLLPAVAAMQALRPSCDVCGVCCGTPATLAFRRALIGDETRSWETISDLCGVCAAALPGRVLGRINARGEIV